jgi:hypothetical protein
MFAHDCLSNPVSDYCNTSEAFPLLIQQRTAKFRTQAGSAELVSQGYWFHYLEDKVAGYLLSLLANVPAPEIYCCVTDMSALSACLTKVYDNSNITGIDVKGTNFHSTFFVLVNNPPNLNRLDLITGTHVSVIDVVTQLSVLQATKIIVEQFIGTSLPTEYKFHVINGKVVAIAIIQRRGSDCPCYAVVDTSWNRLDTSLAVSNLAEWTWLIRIQNVRRLTLLLGKGAWVQ